MTVGVQDFPGGGGANSQDVEASLLFSRICTKNFLKMKEISLGGGGGGRTPG